MLDFSTGLARRLFVPTLRPWRNPSTLDCEWSAVPVLMHSAYQTVQDCALRSLGTEQWTKTLGDSRYFIDSGDYVTQTEDGGYIVTGSTSTYSNLPDQASEVWLIKVGPDTGWISGIDQEKQGPSSFSLSQNLPNPFNPTTAIGYRLSAISNVDLSIYNVLGQKVVTLVSEKKKAGQYQVEWDASRFASGIYFYILRAGEYRDVKKMVLLK